MSTNRSRGRRGTALAAALALCAAPAAAVPPAGASDLPAPGAADRVLASIWPLGPGIRRATGARSAPPPRRTRPARPPAPSASDMEHLTDDPPQTPGGRAARDTDPRDRRVHIEVGSDRAPKGATLLPATSGPSTQNLPSGCGVWSWTYRDGGRAKGSGLVSCTGRQPVVYARTVLERRRWYGWQVLDDDESKRSGAAQVASVSRWRCTGVGDYTYASGAYGTVVAANGRTYHGAVATRNRFDC